MFAFHLKIFPFNAIFKPFWPQTPNIIREAKFAVDEALHFSSVKHNTYYLPE